MVSGWRKLAPVLCKAASNAEKAGGERERSESRLCITSIDERL